MPPRLTSPARSRGRRSVQRLCLVEELEEIVFGADGGFQHDAGEPEYVVGAAVAKCPGGAPYGRIFPGDNL
jgi:hypothetical protein